MLTPPPATLALARRLGGRLKAVVRRLRGRDLPADARPRGRRVCPSLSIEPEGWRLLIDTIDDGRARGTGVALLVEAADWRVAVEALDLWAGPVDLLVDPDHLEPETAVPEAPPPLRGGVIQTADPTFLVDRLRQGLHLAAVEHPVDGAAVERLCDAARAACAPVLAASVDGGRLTVEVRQRRQSVS